MRLPSIRGRLANALLLWALLWGAATALAVGLAAQREVDELLDDTLLASADVLAALLENGSTAAPSAQAAGRGGHFAWQVVDAGGQVRLRSALAPTAPLLDTPAPGLSSTRDWRVLARPLGQDGRLLYVAQAQDERGEARAEIALSTALASLGVGLLGHFWLRQRVRRELEPLAALTQRLATVDPLHLPATLGAAEREELQPVQQAIDDLAGRLARRIASERAFSGHAAHALRTPLAGIDAQLAVALREAPAALQPRLQRARDAASRLQRVVAALLGLFRAGADPQRAPVDLGALLARLPVQGLDVQVQPGGLLLADPDLLAAALLNLLDNALRHGARQVHASVPQPGLLRLQDDGPGVDAARRATLQQALDDEDYEGRTGLGLMLADRVARAHGGRLRLLPAASGFVVELSLQGDIAPAAPGMPQR